MKLIVRERQSKINTDLYFFENVQFVEVKFPYLVVYSTDYDPIRHCFRLSECDFQFIP